MDRLSSQISFIIELDKLKTIHRQTWLIDATRRENSAEHSWHIAMMALILQEHSKEPVDLQKVVKMLLIHDIVEIDAGDVLVYDTAGQQQKAEREQQAAARIFGLLPDDQTETIRQLWQEFEAGTTAEARFAAALDRLMPLLHNYLTEGRAWQQHGITAQQVLTRNAHIAEGSPQLWEYAKEIVQQSVQKGYLAN